MPDSRRPRRFLSAPFGLVGSIAVAILLFASGCGRLPEGSSAPAKTPLRFAAIVLQEDQYFRMVEFGMRDAAREAGVELLIANSNSRPEKEIELINTYVAQKVDAILISPLSRKGSITALQLAHDKGIAVVCYNMSVEAGDVYAAYIECSSTDLGRRTGIAARDYIEKQRGGKAKMAIIAFKSLLPEQSEERAGTFKSEVSKLPGVDVVAEQDAWLPEMAVKKVGDILTAHPDVDLIYAANEGGTIGAVLAVKNAGKSGQITVFGTDSSEQLLAMLQSPDNILQAIASQRPVEVGRLTVETALKALKHQPVERKIILPGILLSRLDPDGVKDFEKRFREWIGR